MSQRSGTFEEFKEHTLAIARGERLVDAGEPKTWSEPKPIQLIDEPDFQSEKDLEDAIAVVVRSVLGERSHAVILRGFGLDLAVFMQSSSGDFRTVFFEIKAFADHHGRCGFGNQRGEGNQIRLLFDELTATPRTKEELSILDPSVRWIVGNRSRSVGSNRYLFFTSQQAQEAAMGGVRPGKQNNLRLSMLTDAWITWPELLKEVKAFISA
jgi:hypothetical protein